MGRAKDLAGQHFGRLTVQYATEKRADQGSIVWHCLCDCGRACDVSARRLTRGKVRSCGCLSAPPPKDYVGSRFGRLTVTEYAGTAKALGRSGTMRYWRCRCSCGKTVVVGQTALQNGETQSCGCLQKARARDAMVLVGDTSAALLARGKALVRADNVSGKTGVSWETRTQSWVAKITFRKRNYWLGRYKDKADAIRVRCQAEAMHDDFLDWYHDLCEKESEPEREAALL